MKKTKSHADFKKKIFEQQFKLAENIDNRISLLEQDLDKGVLTEKGFKDLIDLYSVSLIIMTI